MEITVGSLFSGIGGLDLGLERAGMKVIWQSEIDKYCCKVLKKHWPEVPNHGDIKEINWQEIERPTVIAGGYPCQPFSQAGKRKGTQDPRHLWPWVRTAISELRPDYAILENVPGHLTLGGTEVIGALAEIGYDAEWRVVSAAGLGANHLRKRIIIVAYPSSKLSNGCDDHTRISVEQKTVSQFGNSCRSTIMADTDNARNGTSRCNLEPTESSSQQHGIDAQHESCRCGQAMANSNSGRQQKCDASIGCVPIVDASRKSVANTDSKFVGLNRTSPNVAETRRIWSNYTERQIGYDFRQWWQVEPNVGRVADGIPNRVDRLRGLGNAVVPQVAEYIGQLVVEHYNSK